MCLPVTVDLPKDTLVIASKRRRSHRKSSSPIIIDPTNSTTTPTLPHHCRGGAVPLSSSSSSSCSSCCCDSCSISKRPKTGGSGGSISLSTSSLFFVATLIVVVLYHGHECSKLQHHYEHVVLSEERQHWESIQQHELLGERHDKERLLADVQVFANKVRAVEVQLDRQTQAVQQAQTQVRTVNEQYQALEHVATIWTESLTRSVQDMYRRNAIQEFGPGPHYVQFELDFHDSSMERQFFTIQLAPLENMPVSVYTFLQQASKRLWDNTGFFVNAPHVLMAKTKSSDLRNSRFADFQRHGLDHLPLPEYSEQYPHEEYTLGFSGDHPLVGPDFYINMSNNVKNHGPSGPLGLGGEPCFGKVLIGRKTIDRIQRLPGSVESLLDSPVSIVTTRLINNLADAVGGMQYLKAQQDRL